MTTTPVSSPKILAVSGSLHRESVTRAVLEHVGDGLRALGSEVDLLDLLQEPLTLFNPDTAYSRPEYQKLRERVEAADVFVLGTPDYHGTISSCLKNFLDHFWKEFSGKLFATLVASHEKGLTVTDHLRTVARQCYAWSLPYGVSFIEKADVQNGEIVNPQFKDRLEMMIHDVHAYGGLIAERRRIDLAASTPGFLAKLRT